MMLPTEPQFWVACTTGVTVLGSVLLQIMKNRQDDKRYERDRQALIDHQDELKRDVAKVATVASAGVVAIRQDVRANTELTAATGAKADRAYEVANNVNEKIASLAAGSAAVARAQDTNDTVHRIEDKV